MIKDRESYRHALSRLARWARFAEERIQELIDEEEAGGPPQGGPQHPRLTTNNPIDDQSTRKEQFQ